MDRKNQLEQKLQALKEFTLTTTFLIPLLKRVFHFDRVEYHGGPNEEGKDIICWYKDEIEDQQVDVAQVKRYRPTAKAADDESFLEIVRQLEQAVTKEIPFTDGLKYRSKRVFLITPYPVDTRALQTGFEAYQLLRHRVTIIDGTKLSALIQEHLPEESARLLGRKFSRTDLLSTLNNQLLTSALQYNRPLDLTEVYTDIDFVLGRISTRLFFLRNFSATTVRRNFGPEEWDQLKAAITLGRDVLGIELLGKRPETYEQKESIQVDKFKAALADRETKARRAFDEKENWTDQVERQRAKLILEDPKLKALHTQARNIYRDIRAFDDARGNITGPEPAPRRELQQKLSSLNDQIRIREKPIEKYRAALDSAIDAVTETRENVVNFKKRDPRKDKRLVSIDGNRLCVSLRHEATWIKTQLAEFRARRPKRDELTKFLRHCEELFIATDALLEITAVATSVGIQPKQLVRDMRSLTRLPLTAEDVFDTGLNFTLLGDAGAGKTTTLVMAAKRRSDLAGEDQAVFFVPLVSLIQAWDKSLIREMSPIETAGDLERALAGFLSERDSTMSPSELQQHFKKRGGTLFLDGIDEVIKVAPGLPRAIREFAEKYPSLQIIVSSRMSGSYVRDIPFLGITLLPFTPPQLRTFIQQSLAKDPIHSAKAPMILAHLKKNPDLSRLVRNPLLATILCVLAKKDVPLPDGEIRLYEQRMRLRQCPGCCGKSKSVTSG